MMVILGKILLGNNNRILHGQNPPSPGKFLPILRNLISLVISLVQVKKQAKEIRPSHLTAFEPESNTLVIMTGRPIWIFWEKLRTHKK